jgi:hypothetical protein
MGDPLVHDAMIRKALPPGSHPALPIREATFDGFGNSETERAGHLGIHAGRAKQRPHLLRRPGKHREGRDSHGKRKARGAPPPEMGARARRTPRSDLSTQARDDSSAIAVALHRDPTALEQGEPGVAERSVLGSHEILSQADPGLAAGEERGAVVEAVSGADFRSAKETAARRARGLWVETNLVCTNFLLWATVQCFTSESRDLPVPRARRPP